MQFTVLVHREVEGPGFWAEVPELPGCNSQGLTLDELEANILDAIETSLEYADPEELERIHTTRRWIVDVSAPEPVSSQARD